MKNLNLFIQEKLVISRNSMPEPKLFKIVKDFFKDTDPYKFYKDEIDKKIDDFFTKNNSNTKVHNYELYTLKDCNELSHDKKMFTDILDVDVFVNKMNKYNLNRGDKIRHVWPESLDRESYFELIFNKEKTAMHIYESETSSHKFIEIMVCTI